MDVPCRADLLELLGPDTDCDLAEVGRTQQVQVGPRLAEAAADGQRTLVVQDSLVLGKLEEVELVADSELHLHGFLGDPDSHRGELVPAPGDRVPNQDVAVEAMHRPAVG